MLDNKKKESLINLISFTKDISNIKMSLNDFFDESFVYYLSNESKMIKGQLAIALKCFDYTGIFTSHQLTTRDKKLLILLLKTGVNIGEIINMFDDTVYCELKQYIKQLFEMEYINVFQIINTNNLGIIQDFVSNLEINYIELYNLLNNDSIGLDIKKYFLSIPCIRETFINKANATAFYELLRKLNLDESFMLSRHNKLQNSLNNPNIITIDFKEIISELICQDSYHNFMLNLELISDYCNSETSMPLRLMELAKSLIIIQSIMKNDTITQEESEILINYCEVIGTNLVDAFSLIKNNFNQNLNSELKKENIYLVHTEDINDLTKNDDIRGNYNKRIHHKSGRISFSLLNEDKTGIYGAKDCVIVFGYNSSPNNKLLSATLGDARTAQSRIWTRSSYLSIDDYLEKTTSAHNELLYEGINEVVEPDYILSFHEEATELEQRVANIFNIPIKYLKEKKHQDNFDSYPDKEYIYNDYNEIQYITNYSELNKIF